MVSTTKTAVRARPARSSLVKRSATSAAAALLALAAAQASAQEIYRAVAEDGSVSFSDFPVEGAERLAVDVIPANEDQAEASEALIEQQLAVAKSLEESRLARRRAETERLEALAARQPQTIYYPVERSTYWGGYWRRPGFGYGPGLPGYGPGYPGYRPGHPGYRPGHPGYRPGHPSQPIYPGKPGRPGGSQPPARQPTLSKPWPTGR